MVKTTGGLPPNFSDESSLRLLLDELSPAELAALDTTCRAALPWSPNPGPQATAYLSDAHELYFGGAAGGGKTQILIGLALTQHRNSLLLRRTAKDSKALGQAIQTLDAGSWKYVGFGGELRTADGRTVEVGGCQHETDKASYQGQPHDLIGFDELPQFLESQYTFIIGWNRVADPRKHSTQRCRVVGAGNPPTNPEGEWVLRRWRAWLDPTAGEVAKPGSLRWYTQIDGEEVECPDGKPVSHKGVEYKPRSRTFIPARLEDNPELLNTGYAATLESMPEPLRSMLRYGDMAAARQDDRWQLIPTAWVVLAQRRWAERTERGTKFGPMTSLGVDVAMGGEDVTVLAPKHSATIGTLRKRKGKETPDGQSVVQLVILVVPGTEDKGIEIPINIDAIGVGKSAYDAAVMMGVKMARAVIVSRATTWSDPRVPALKFANTRSAMMWKVRSLLDPEGGPSDSRLALPPDRMLLADLTAPRYELRTSGVFVESKDDIRLRIGRSTNDGDAVGLACWEAGGLVYAGPK